METELQRAETGSHQVGTRLGRRGAMTSGRFQTEVRTSGVKDEALQWELQRVDLIEDSDVRARAELFRRSEETMIYIYYVLDYARVS